MFRSTLEPEQLEQVRQKRSECLVARSKLRNILGDQYNLQHLNAEIDALLDRIFPVDGSFHPVESDRERALLDLYLTEARKAGRFTVLHEHQFQAQYGHLYYNALTATSTIAPEGIYAASMPVLDNLFRHITDDSTPKRIVPSKAHIAVVWRAAIVGLESAYRANIRKAIHYGMSRNGTPRSTVYYRGESAQQQVRSDAQVIGFDPMFATGGTMLDLNDALRSQGFLGENIHLAAMFGAPEGLVRVLRQRPEVGGVTIGRLEQGMDDHAYLFNMRVGDFGDLVAPALQDRIRHLSEIQMISDDEATRLVERFATGK